MIRLHHLDQSRSFRIAWLMEELELPYDLVCHQRQPDHRAAATLREVHALGRAPVIVDGETVMFECGAIVEYVIHRYGQGRLSVPCHHMDYAPYLVWLHAAEGTAMLALMPLITSQFGGPAATEAERTRNDAMLQLCDETLSGRDYFGGQVFSAADIMMQLYVALNASFAAESYARHPNLPRFLDRVQARAGFRRAAEVTEAAVVPA